uniref:CDAN1-interacting nuclease 1 n=1 Tax=Cacopsylla melanoneura TaxID=428564 RepID=A0A8D8WMG7_9HEMI
MEILGDSNHMESLESNALPLVVYESIQKVLDTQPLPSIAFNREMVLKEIYPNIPLETIASIIQYHYQKKTKKQHHLLRNHGDTIYFKFLDGLQRGKVNVASSLAIDYQQAPYLISQLILQKHFAKHWENDHYIEMKAWSKTGQGNSKPVSNDIKVIVPKQLSFDQEFPSLKDTGIKQRRVAPTLVQNNKESNLGYSNTIGNKSMHFKIKTSPVSPAPLSLSDVMVIKTKKSKKGVHSNINKQASERLNDAIGEASSRIVENLILDKDKNKLFDRILNKTNSKETILKESYTLRYSEEDTKNNNVDLMEDSPILPSHLTPKKVKFSWKQRMVVKKESLISEECEDQIKSEEKQDSGHFNSSPKQEDHVTPKRKQHACSDPNENRVTPKRIQTQSTSNKQPNNLLSSIHFMTQNCQSKDELYESYRKKLERLNERFTNELRLTKVPECEDKKKINKLVERMNIPPQTVHKPMTKVYLNTLEGTERSIAQVLLIEKMKSVERGDIEEPQEFLMTQQDLLEWKNLVISLQCEPFALFQEVSKFWARFPPKPREIDGPKGYLKRMLRDPLLITDPILSMEISMCNAVDDQYGPVIELYRRSLGLAHEAKVMSHLTECGIVFQSEKLCMTLNFDKTPDVLLDPPLWLSDRPVHWIESKALFGNPENHATYRENQYIPYYQRFGPGLVIYWFGFVDSICIHTPEYMIVTNMPPRHLMTQPLPDGYKDRATFLDKFGHVIRVSVEEKDQVGSQATGSQVGRPKGKTVTGHPQEKDGSVTSPSKLTFGSEKVRSVVTEPVKSSRVSPVKRKSLTDAGKPSKLSFGFKGNGVCDNTSDYFADAVSDSSVHVASHCDLNDKLPADNLLNKCSSHIRTDESRSSQENGQKTIGKSTDRLCSDSLSEDTIPLSNSPKPCTNPLNVSTEAGSTIVCSTPLKSHDTIQRPLRTPDSGVLCSPHHPGYGLSCKKQDSFSRSHDSSSTRSHDVSSQFDISSVSNCSMCDIPPTERSTCSATHCSKSPVCFASRCSDKLLAFTAPCVCSHKLLTDKNASFSDNDKSLTDNDKLNVFCSHMERNK